MSFSSRHTIVLIVILIIIIIIVVNDFLLAVQYSCWKNFTSYRVFYCNVSLSIKTRIMLLNITPSAPRQFGLQHKCLLNQMFRCFKITISSFFLSECFEKE